MGNWFDTNTKKGKTTLERQMVGLEYLQEMVPGKSVLDVGCAEGKIAAMMLQFGATEADGVENRLDAVKHARSLGVNAIEADANLYVTWRAYDLVLALGILHKLASPAESLNLLLMSCAESCVIRLPAGQWPVLRDSRSGGVPIDLGDVAEKNGFVVVRETAGPIDEDRGPQAVIYLERQQ